MAMKINGDPNLKALQDIQKTQQQKQAEQKGKSREVKDKVEFSEELQKADRSNHVTSIQDQSRVEQLQALKDQIARGEYSPDLQQVASSLLKSIFRGK
jgi:flagellar biosynthesis anti-sigma factor FlgM